MDHPAPSAGLDAQRGKHHRHFADLPDARRLWETDYKNIIRRAFVEDGLSDTVGGPQEIRIRTAQNAAAPNASGLLAASPSTRREHLQRTLPGTVGLLHQRRADLIGDELIGAYVALDWLEWNGGTLRLTIVGENICAGLRAADAA